MERPLVILGAGGFASELLWYALAAGYQELVFVDDTLPGPSTLERGRHRFPVVTDWAAFRREDRLAHCRQFLIGVANTALKRRLVARAIEHGLSPAPTLVHPDARIHGGDCVLGAGGVLAPGAQLTANVTLGDFVVVGVNCAIGHDAVLGDFVSCNPGCHVSGNVVLGAGVLIGTGASVKEKVRIAEDVTIGAQACVIRDVTTPGATLVGVPARALESPMPTVRPR